MEKFSEWNKIDLHIHSKESNKVKPNDYDGEEYTATELLDALSSKTNKVNIFSITDHNCINKELYEELEKQISKEKYEGIINYIVGVEMDIKDPDIYKDVFHCLCFFESKDIGIIEQAISEAFNNKPLNLRNSPDIYPSINKIFNAFAKKGIKDILLIPHFNNKQKGLPSDIAIENLNYLCFNAYEDSNNIKNIQKSLNIYKKAGYDNFPFAVFTDNHDLSIYPKDKNKNNNEIECYILGNISNPFNAVKTAFQEARMRISLSSIVGMRSIEYPEKYVNKIYIGEKNYNLSPYQNTIVGKFGSGKSLLLKKIKDGSDNLEFDSKYQDFYDENEKSKIFVGNQQYNSLNELTESNYKIYEFLQQESYYYKNEFSLSDAKELFKQINIVHTFNEDIKYNFNKEEIISQFTEFKELVEKTDGKNNLNYERAFDNRNYYSFSTTYSQSNIIETINELNEKFDILVDIGEMKINDVSVFTDEEKNNINDIVNIVNNKCSILEKYSELKIESNLQETLNQYNSVFVNNNAKDLKDILISDLEDFRNKLKSFYQKCKNFESIFTRDVYEDNKKIKMDTIIDNYSISWKYNPEEEYKSIIDQLIKSENRQDTLFISVIQTLKNKDENNFASNKDFEYHIKKYVGYANSLFTTSNIRYDILKNGDSLLRKSAGEKSSLFIEFIFDLLEKDLKNKIGILLILDQPEDNIDNDNIFNQISTRIRDLKCNYNNFQSIIVTHNANVAITADSENIIIANELLDESGNKTFNYDMGCIEDKTYIDRVCKILEGGRQAMEKRTIKYGINIIRKVEENGI